MRDTATAKNRNRRIRQEALREQLEKQGHIQHVVDLLEKLSNEESEVNSDMLQRYKLVIDTKIKLISKYLPDLKSTEIVGDPENPLVTSVPVSFVDAEDTTSK